MTTFATPDTDRRAQLDAATRVAWTDYRDALSGLAGDAYEAAEATEWERLQATLRELADLRAGPPRPAAAD